MAGLDADISVCLKPQRWKSKYFKSWEKFRWKYCLFTFRMCFIVVSPQDKSDSCRKLASNWETKAKPEGNRHARIGFHQKQRRREESIWYSIVVSSLLTHKASSQILTLFSHSNDCGPQPDPAISLQMAPGLGWLGWPDLSWFRAWLEKTKTWETFFNCVLPLLSQEKGFAGCPEGRLSEWAMKVKWKRGFVVCWRWVVLLAHTCVNREITASCEAMALSCRALGPSPSVCSLGPRKSVGPLLLPLRGKGTGSSPASQLGSGPVLRERPRAPSMSFHNGLLLLRRWNICLPHFYLAHLQTEVSLSLK